MARASRCVAAVAAVFAVVVAACGTGEGVEPLAGSTTQTPAEASPAAVASAGLLGRWSSDLPKSVEQFQKDGEGLPPSGTYTLDISEERIALSLPSPHRFPTLEIVSMTDPAAATGTMVLADRDALKDDACFEGHLGDEGEYRWTIDDGGLRFETVEDSCVDRPLILGSSEWVRTSP